MLAKASRHNQYQYFIMHKREDSPSYPSSTRSVIYSTVTNVMTFCRQIDLPAAQPERIAAQMQSTFGIDPSNIISISAKTGNNVESILEAIIKRIPPPIGRTQAPLKAFLFDSL
jgi:translation elongation factor EF-4